MSMQPYTYTSHTIRALARCFNVSREMMYQIANYLKPQDMFLLVHACCTFTYIPSTRKLSETVHDVAIEFAETGHLPGLQWLDSAGYQSPHAADFVIIHDDVPALKWLVEHKWITISDRWMLNAWDYGSIKCAEWLRSELTSSGLNQHLLLLDFSTPCSFD
jgi:hypothetical protein